MIHVYDDNACKYILYYSVTCFKLTGIPQQ